MTATTIRPRSRTDHARRGGHRTAITPPRQPNRSHAERCTHHGGL